MAERFKTIVVALVALCFAVAFVSMSLVSVLLGLGFAGYGLEVGPVFLGLALAGLVFAGFFTVRVLVPLSRLALAGNGDR